MFNNKSTGIILAVISCILLTATFAIPEKNYNLGASPRTLPFLASLIMLLFSILHVFFSRPDNKSVSHNKSAYLKAVLAVCSVLLYIFIIESIGYIVSTAFLITAISFVMGLKHPLKIIIFAVVLSFSTWLVFTHLFTIYLPRGKFI